MSTLTTPLARAESSALRIGSALMALAAAGFIGFVALPAHYPYGFDTIGHLGLIYLATAIFVVGAALAGKALLEERR
jgi:hypothetical protein